MRTVSVDGIVTIGGNGSAADQSGMAVHIYAANTSMIERYFYNADGEMLIVPQLGRARFVTELGVLEVANGEIAIIPRGLRFRVELPEGEARGYLCENFGAPLQIRAKLVAAVWWRGVAYRPPAWRRAAREPTYLSCSSAA